MAGPAAPLTETPAEVTPQAPPADPPEVAAPLTPEPEGTPPAETGTPETAPEGDAATPEVEGGRDLSAIQADIDAVVERRVQAEIAAKEASLEERARTRAREEDDGLSKRRAYYDNAITWGEQEYRNLVAIGEAIDRGDDPGVDAKALNSKLSAFGQAIRMAVAKGNEDSMTAYVDEFLPKRTPAEEKELEPLLHVFRQDGTIGDLTKTVATLAMSRKDVRIKELEAQLGKQTETKTLAEKFYDLAANGAVLPAGTPPPKAPAGR